MIFYSIIIFAQKKAIMILIDGVPADVIERVNTPHLDEIAELGGYTRAYQGGMKDGFSQTPTVSAPGYMNMITGTWANKHNVRDNAVKNPNYNYWNIFRIAETVNPELSTAIFSTWQDNRTKLIGEGKQEAGGIQLDYSFDGFELDTNRFPHKSDRKYIFDIDELVSSEAASYIEKMGPDLSWVYLEFTDDMGHKFGDSPQMDEAVMKADKQIGRIWDAIKKRKIQFNEDWMAVITTDHGRNPETGKGHGGQSARERTTWIFTNSSNLNEHFEDSPGVVDILPSILNHLGFQVSESIRGELDGVSFVGEISITNPSASLNASVLNVKWKAIENVGNVEIYLTPTNNFKTGGKDDYRLVGEAPVSNETLKIKLDDPESFYKVLIKAPKNWVTTWVGNQ